MVCFGNKEQPKLPCIIMGEDKVDPLRDERVAKVVRKQGMKHCRFTYTPLLFSPEDLMGILFSPNGIATNSSGQFIVADMGKVKIYDPTGQFIQHLNPNGGATQFGLREDRRLVVEFESLVLNCGPKF